MNKFQVEDIESVLSAISDEDLIQFSKEYVRTHPEMLKALCSRYGLGNDKKSEPFDYKKEVSRCYTNVMKRVRWERDWSRQPDYLDWEKVGDSLRKVIKLAEKQIISGNPLVAVETALTIIDQDLIQYEEDLLYEREDWGLTDLCIDKSVALIAKAFESPNMTDRQKLDICDRLEQYTGKELFEEYDTGAEELIEKTRNALLSDDEYLAILKRKFELENSGWKKDCLACEIWDFLMEKNRASDAIELYRQHPELDDLKDSYIDYLVSLEQFNEAISTLDKTIKSAKKRYLDGLVCRWRERKLEVLEEMKDTPAMIVLCKELFYDAHGNDVLKYYHKLKDIITPDQWHEFRDKMLLKYNRGNDADSPLSAIYAEENMIPQLFDLLASCQYNLVYALQKYVKLFDAKQQKALVAHLESEYIRGLDYNPTRRSYQNLASRIKVLAKICPAAHELAVKALNYYLLTYTNRPALQEELLKVKI